MFSRARTWGSLGCLAALPPPSWAPLRRPLRTAMWPPYRRCPGCGPEPFGARSQDLRRGESAHFTISTRYEASAHSGHVRVRGWQARDTDVLSASPSRSVGFSVWQPQNNHTTLSPTSHYWKRSVLGVYPTQDVLSGCYDFNSFRIVPVCVCEQLAMHIYIDLFHSIFYF